METQISRGWNEIPNVVLDQIFAYLSWPDKVNASSTCKRWRCGLYHPCFWKSISFSLKMMNKDKEEKAKYFMHTFGKIVRNVDILFDSLDPMSSLLTDDLLNILSGNTQLNRLMLIPNHCALYPSKNNSCNASVLNSSRMYHHILTILTKTDKLEELSIGCLHDLIVYCNQILKTIADHHSKTIRILGIASMKYDPEEYVYDSLDFHYLKNYENLQVLSVNYDYVNDDFLQVLCSCSSLKRIIIHIHSNVQDHPGTTDAKWTELVKYCPNVELRLNVIHAYYAALELEKTILKKAMPLTHLRLFFCETLNDNALNSLHMYSNSLRSLWWVDSPVYSDSDVLVKDDFNMGNMNPFIFASWRCVNLEEIVLIGYKYFVDDLRAISRLRGNVLKNLVVLRSEMMESFDDTASPTTTSREIEQEVSECMGKSWKPMKKKDVHPVIFHPDKYDSDEYLIPILCKDLEL